MMVKTTKSKLICNVGLDDVFFLPGVSPAYRKVSLDKVTIVEDGKKKTAYECEDMSNHSMVMLKGNERVDVVYE